MVLVKDQELFHIVISAKTLRENVFDELLQRENTFVDNKNNKLINSKNWDFSNGVSPWVWSKISNFSMFLCQAKQARKMCFTIIQRGKTTFLTLKTTTSYSRKIGIFPKGLVHGFGQKLAIFPSFYLSQKMTG